jgi:hypothetical protein
MPGGMLEVSEALNTPPAKPVYSTFGAANFRPHPRTHLKIDANEAAAKRKRANHSVVKRSKSAEVRRTIWLPVRSGALQRASDGCPEAVS